MHLRTGFTALFVASLLAWPLDVLACTCMASRDLHEALTSARDEAVSIFLGRVEHIEVEYDKSDSTRALRHRVTLEVLENYKGTVSPRKVVTTPPTSSRCGYPFTEGARFLVYAGSDEQDALWTGRCTRTQRLEEEDSVEVRFLRTGALPPRPVALRREQLSCTHCDQQSVATVLGCAGGTACQPTPVEKLPTAIREGRPFWSRSRVPGSKSSHVYGMTTEGRAFALVQRPSRSDDRCVMQVERYGCERLSLLPAESGKRPRVECVGPTPAERVCDEGATRRSSWGPVEAFPRGRCHWQSAQEPLCALDSVITPVEGGARAVGPGLLCSPSSPDSYSCRRVPDVSQTPPDTRSR